MLQLKLTHSKQILVGIIAVHLMVFLLFLNANLLLFTPILIVYCIFSIKKWVNLTDKNSIQSIIIQQKQWLIKINHQWQKATLVKIRFFGWVFLTFKHQTDFSGCLIAPDSLAKNDFLDLIIALNTHRSA